MKIRKALFTPGVSSFFFDDQKAVKQGAVHDGFVYSGKAVTGGFRSIRISGQSVSVNLKLENGMWAAGDCAAVQYSGAGGRDPVFLSSEFIPFLEKNLKPLLEGYDIKSFRQAAGFFEQLKFGGKIMHTAIRYGISQALLDAAALIRQKSMADIIIEEYNCVPVLQRVPIFGQSGDNRYENVDKMILKQVDVLPHGLINNIEEKLGRDGSKLKEYIAWLVSRIKKLAVNKSYYPVLHIDVYGTVGTIFNNHATKIADYLVSLESCAYPHELYIEGPVDMNEKPAQINVLSEIKQELEKKSARVKIVADEWCNTLEDIREFTDARACHMVQIKTPDLGGIQNTIESVLYCRENGMEAYQGGTCNETDLSSRVCVHAALAARPHRILAKPGMGFDEGFTIVNNEMERTLAILREEHK
ncbi:MAG: methylaspartate ammonia-lyase [Spirochaetes bacterium GWF1_41_5]|nr:MAG: methylaspartate ammonia-lyase [Spirochaetes bacterium GWF1_41_5]HBE02517.1 methylaspartate ammonia-lyase [Spirochaetia bacterium]